MLATLSGSTVTRLAEAALPTRFGRFRIAIFHVGEGRQQVVALWRGLPARGPVLLRLHSECLTGDVLGSARCDCGTQLEASLRRLARARSGLLLYLHQEGRGIGLVNKIRAYALQDGGLDTVDANRALGLPVDARDYGVAVAVLREMGINRVRLLSNNPAKWRALREHGIEVVERVPLEIDPNPSNLPYLRTKRDRMGHLLRLHL
ncbi:MAG: GTP cyclohydrolase II [Chloroflexi bacterium]|nr:MAG: GTP cyclohydrolase II [Chloroflexota bacterium]TME44172.1 MAG: GTP cyclohydrolase II [Chloroflexota bacterium]